MMSAARCYIVSTGKVGGELENNDYNRRCSLEICRSTDLFYLSTFYSRPMGRPVPQAQTVPPTYFFRSLSLTSPEILYVGFVVLSPTA